MLPSGLRFRLVCWPLQECVLKDLPTSAHHLYVFTRRRPTYTMKFFDAEPKDADIVPLAG